MSLVLVHIYGPTTQVFEKAPDGVWESSYGPVTSKTFYALPDESCITEAGLRRIVTGGSEPIKTLVAPEGSTLVIPDNGRACMLKRKDKPAWLRTPDGKLHDAINALIFGRSGAHGLTVLRTNQRLSADGRSIEGFLSVEFSPVPVAAKAAGPAKQLSLFGEVG